VMKIKIIKIFSLSCRAQSRHLVTVTMDAARFLHFVPTYIGTSVGMTELSGVVRPEFL
jgi:hypothetical protein